MSCVTCEGDHSSLLFMCQREAHRVFRPIEIICNVSLPIALLRLFSYHVNCARE